MSRCSQGPGKGKTERGYSLRVQLKQYVFCHTAITHCRFSFAFLRGSNRLAERNRPSDRFQVPPVVRRHCAFTRWHNSGKVTLFFWAGEGRGVRRSAGVSGLRLTTAALLCCDWGFERSLFWPQGCEKLRWCPLSRPFIVNFEEAPF